ncbi:MAG TPA: hypothetical protein VHZ52_00270 [Acidobacteriaceae bacterium]|jgi:hypothetical protein|nr:hypothetical protein [Acidobacteriaceae bacterium]
MYSLFALLFQKSYWQMMFRGSTWSDAWRSLRRVHKDSRARKHLRHFLWLLIIPVLCIAYLCVLAGSRALYVVLVIFLFFWLRNRYRRKNAAALHVTPQPAPIHRLLSAEDRRALRARFADLALLLAVLLDRAGSENYLRDKVLPDNVEVVSRRIHIDLLKSRDLWDTLEPPDREAIMMPDGAWTPRQVNIVVNRCFEPFRLMRWVLRLDFHLPVIGKHLRFDYHSANELVRNPAKLLAPGDQIIEQSNVETARDAARQFLLRCYAEEVARGYTVPDEEETTQWANSVSSSMSGKQSVDFLLEENLVSEATRDQLEWATHLSRTRLHFLNWILSIEDQPDPPRLNFACFPVPAPEPTEDPAEDPLASSQPSA